MDTVAVAPTSVDVLCGTGYEAAHHPGNHQFKQIVANHFERYAKAKTKKEKMYVSKVILDEVITTGTRFLKKDTVNQHWYIADIKVGKDKISHCLRDLKKVKQEGGTIPCFTPVATLSEQDPSRDSVQHCINSRLKIESYQTSFPQQELHTAVPDSSMLGQPLPHIDIQEGHRIHSFNVDQTNRMQSHQQTTTARGMYSTERSMLTCQPQVAIKPHPPMNMQQGRLLRQQEPSVMQYNPNIPYNVGPSTVGEMYDRNQQWITSHQGIHDAIIPHHQYHQSYLHGRHYIMHHASYQEQQSHVQNSVQQHNVNARLSGLHQYPMVSQGEDMEINTTKVEAPCQLVGKPVVASLPNNQEVNVLTAFNSSEEEQCSSGDGSKSKVHSSISYDDDRPGSKRGGKSLTPNSSNSADDGRATSDDSRASSEGGRSSCEDDWASSEDGRASSEDSRPFSNDDRPSYDDVRAVSTSERPLYSGGDRDSSPSYSNDGQMCFNKKRSSPFQPSQDGHRAKPDSKSCGENKVEPYATSPNQFLSVAKKDSSPDSPSNRMEMTFQALMRGDSSGGYDDATMMDAVFDGMEDS